MFRQPITIFNRYEDPATKMDKFHKTVIDNAYWEATEGVQLGAINISSSNSISVVIPYTTPGYVSPGEYVGTGWTLAENDYIVKGVFGSNITNFSDLKNADMKMVIHSYEVNDYGFNPRINTYTADGK